MSTDQYYLEFTNRKLPDSGLMFPCDKDGNVDENALPPLARENLKYTEEHPEEFINEGVVSY